MARRAKLTYPAAMYNPIALKQISEADLRKEYSRLRSIARKRIERIGKSEWGTDNIMARMPQITKTKDLSESQLRARTSELAKFLQKDTSTVTGMNLARKRAVETLGKRYPELKGKITVKNWRSFAEFMEYARELHQNRMYDSERIAEFYAEHEGGANLLDEFDKWMKDNAQNPGKLKSDTKVGSGVWREA